MSFYNSCGVFVFVNKKIGGTKTKKPPKSIIKSSKFSNIEKNTEKN